MRNISFIKILFICAYISNSYVLRIDSTQEKLGDESKIIINNPNAVTRRHS